jgi:hypothetical protein
LVKPETVIGDVPVPVIDPGLEVAVYVNVPVPLPVKAGAVKVTDAEAFPAVADPIVGASGLRPFWELVMPMISIFELYHSINSFWLFPNIYNIYDAMLKFK